VFHKKWGATTPYPPQKGGIPLKKEGPLQLNPLRCKKFPGKKGSPLEKPPNRGKKAPLPNGGPSRPQKTGETQKNVKKR